MKVVCIVQARMGSKRLPGKVLLPLNSHTVIGEVLTRCKRIPGVDEVVCAIPQQDDKLMWEISKYVSGFRGDEHDVLSRYYGAAEAYNADIIMRITGDCPLISPELCGEILRQFKEHNAVYGSNLEPRTFPKGLDCEVFTMNALALANSLARDEKDREHVTTFMREAQRFVKTVNITNPWPIEGRLCIDTEDDYKVCCAHFGHEPYATGSGI